METANKILTEIETKEKLVEDLHKKLNQLTDLEIKEANQRTEIMNSDLSKVIEGRITDKSKVAYCDSQVKDKTERITWLRNDVAKLKRNIELCDDRISCYKYMIREMEL